MFETLRAYIEAVAYFAVTAAFIQMLAGERLRTGISFILGIMLLALICRPLGALLRSDISPKFEYRTEDVSKYDEMRENIILNGMKAQLEQELVRRTGAKRAEAEFNADNSVKSVVLYGADENARSAAALVCGIAGERVSIEKEW